MAAATPAHMVTVWSDHDFPNGTVLTVHAARRPAGSKPFLYRGWQDFLAGRGPAEWVLLHRTANDPPPPARVSGPAGFSYRWEAAFPYARASEWEWNKYRRAEPR